MYNMFYNKLNHLLECLILEGNCLGSLNEIFSSCNTNHVPSLMKEGEFYL
jgi:hypothetical protein